MFGSDQDGDKIEERKYDSDEEFIYAKTKDNTKRIIKTKHITKPKTKTEDCNGCSPIKVKENFTPPS